MLIGGEGRVCAHWWWSWSVLIGDGADLTGGGAGRVLTDGAGSVCSLMELVCAH